MVYVAENELKKEDLDKLTRDISIKTAATSIDFFLRTRHRWIKNGEGQISIFSFASMIFIIYVLAKGSLPTYDIVCLALYVVVVGLAQLPLVFVCILIALSPLICIMLIIACCCCKDSNTDKFIDISPQ